MMSTQLPLTIDGVNSTIVFDIVGANTSVGAEVTGLARDYEQTSRGDQNIMDHS
jgi:hypothetical protein